MRWPEADSRPFLSSSGPPAYVPPFRGPTSFLLKLVPDFVCLSPGCMRAPPAAIGHFTLELLVFRTMTLKNALSPMAVAAISSTWMALGYSTYVH